MADFEGEFWIIRDDNQKANAAAALALCEVSKSSPLCVQLAEYKETRTEKQNRYIWGWVYTQLARILEDGGIVIHLEDGKSHPWTKELLHETFKKMFLAKSSLVTKRGKEIILYESTANLSKKKFNEYLQSIAGFALDFWKVSVPEPNRGMFAVLLEEVK